MSALEHLMLDADDIDFEHYMRETEMPTKVRSPAFWLDELLDEFGPNQAAQGCRLPWDRLADKIALRKFEVSLWFGFNGHGKSLILGQAMLSACAQGEKVCVASFEMRPRKTLGRMVRQVVGRDDVSPQDVRRFCEHLEGRLWVYDQTSTVEPERVFAVIRYAAEKLGVSHFVVDNLTKCVASDDDYQGQKAIVDKLTALAQALGIHIHLVHHARKDRDETRPPRKMDALGASAITNLVDNVFIVWRNKARTDKEDKKLDEPDAMFICDKQRHGTGWEGLQNLWFHWGSQQYLGSNGYHAIDMTRYPHAQAYRRREETM